VRGGRVVALDRRGPQAVAALIVDGRVEDVLIDPPPGDRAPRPETVWLGRIERVAPAVGASFVTLPDGGRGWLRGADGRPGETRIVQATRWADPGKATPLTDRPVLKGRLAIATPGAPGGNVARSVRGHAARDRLTALAAAALNGCDPDVGLVLRSAAAGADDDAVLAEARGLLAEVDALAAAMGGREARLLRPAPDAHVRALRDWTDPAPDAVDDAPDAFERLGVWDALAALRFPEAPLPGGGWIAVEATAAMVAVDVNTGEDFSKGAAQRANLEACAELPRQLRLRGLGGLVIVDFAPVKKGARQGIDQALARALASDPVETRVGGWTPLGNLELSRRRERRPLRETLHD
jgi:Ribonuclease G/E